MSPPTIVALRDVTANLRARGPAWTYWQLPAERLIGTLTRMIHSQRFPYVALTSAVSAKYSAELMTSFAETKAAGKWAEATGKPVRRKHVDPVGTFLLSKSPNLDLLPQSRKSSDLVGLELTKMKAVLTLEGAAAIPDMVIAKKYFRLRLGCGQIVGTVPRTDDVGDRRRDHLVLVSSRVL